MKEKDEAAGNGMGGMIEIYYMYIYIIHKAYLGRNN
jgi:hypothetical protein